MTLKNKKSRILLTLICTLGLLCLGLILFLKSPVFKAELATKESHLEIGTKPETNPDFYLDGTKWSIPLAHVDSSSVKYTKVGRYPIYIYHGFQKYTSYVNVTDTTAPLVSCEIKNKTVTPGKTVSVHSLGLDIEDYSEIESIYFTKIASTKFYTGLPDSETEGMREAYRKGISMEAEEFQFAYGGIYTLTIRVSDIFHNASEITLTLKVEEPPVIEVAEQFYTADTKEIDFKKYIKVWDFITGDLDVEDVQVDTSQLTLAKVGSYPVTFTVTDEYGLTATKVVTVHVSSPEKLQELINTHVADPASSIIIGAKNPYDSGYYTSQNMEFIQNIMLPSIVNIKNDSLDTFGSGFIIEITDEFVTIATNEHVIHNDLSVDVTFFDTSSCSGAVVAADEKRDIAFVRVLIKDTDSSSSLSIEHVKKLRTVHINKGYWDSLAEGSNITLGYNCIDENGKIWRTATGYMVEKEVLRDWNEFKDINETIISIPPVPGTSGSALFDAYGRLVGMIRGYTDYDGYTETVAVPLSEILSYFEIIFKYKIHYQ